MPRKSQKIRNTAGFAARRVRTKTGKRVTRWMRTRPLKNTVNPLAGPSTGPLPPRNVVPSDLHTVAFPSDFERTESYAAATDRARTVIDGAVASGVLPYDKSVDDLVGAELRRLAAQELLQMRRAEMLLETAGIDDVKVTGSFARDVEAGGLDHALARIHHKRAFMWRADVKTREADIRDAWKGVSFRPRLDDKGDVLLLASDYTPLPEPAARIVEIWLEAAEHVRDGDPRTIAAYAEAWVEQEGLA